MKERRGKKAQENPYYFLYQLFRRVQVKKINLDTAVSQMVKGGMSKINCTFRSIRPLRGVVGKVGYREIYRGRQKSPKSWT